MTDEPMVIDPDLPCVDPDGHSMNTIESADSWLPVAVLCGRCGRYGRVKRDTIPRDTPAPT